MKCGDYIKSKNNNTECEASEFVCSGARQWMGGDGTCKTCADFSVISADKKSCVAPDCATTGAAGNAPTNKTATTADGTCVLESKCPSWTKLNAVSKKCVVTDCSANTGDGKLWVGLDGVCYATGSCPSYSKE